MKKLLSFVLVAALLVLPTGIISADDPGGTIGPTSTPINNVDE